MVMADMFFSYLLCQTFYVVRSENEATQAHGGAVKWRPSCFFRIFSVRHEIEKPFFHLRSRMEFSQVSFSHDETIDDSID